MDPIVVAPKERVLVALIALRMEPARRVVLIRINPATNAINAAVARHLLRVRHLLEPALSP